jgi:hypothetical protein
VLDGGGFNMASGQSWGRFNQQMDSIAIHPAGYAVGVSTAQSHLEVLPLLQQSVADNVAPAAMIKGGLGERPGLMHNPLAIVVTVDGRLLILDQSYTSDSATWPARIQALDVHGNPVSCFQENSSAEMSLKDESDTVTYLDLGIESKGYIYVLKIIGDPSASSDYALDIYQPDGTFLAQTKGITAGKMAVSLWRDVYTLNFEMLTGPNGPEPSVSWWAPSVPTES